MQGGVINDDIVIVREGTNAFTLAIKVAGQWLAIGTIKDALTSVVPLLVQTRSSPAERTNHAHRTERLAEYQAQLDRDEAAKLKRRKHGEELERRALEQERERLARRSGIIG